MSEEPPVDRRKLSTIPSWVMLGFVLGALVMFGYRSRSSPTEAPEQPPAAVQAEEPAPGEARNSYAYEDQPSFSVVEALFEQYRSYAFWEDERTEIAIWNTRTLDFTDCFELLRGEHGTYYRSIPRLTRLPLPGYGPPNCPVLFTETALQRAARIIQRNAKLPRPQAPAPVDLPRVPVPPRGN